MTAQGLEWDAYKDEVLQDIEDFFQGLTQRLHKNEFWAMLQFGRGDNLNSAPIYQMICVPQHSIKGAVDKHLKHTADLYDIRLLLSNVDYEQWGYLLKLMFLHYQMPVPQWIRDVQKAYFDPTPAERKAKETRAKLAKPEGIVRELEKTAPVGSRRVQEFSQFTPAQFGDIIRQMYEEVFGAAIFEVGAEELVEGTVYWDNHRIFVSLFSKYITRGCDTATADPETEVSDEETEETSNASTLMRPEDARWSKTTSGSASKADEGNVTCSKITQCMHS